MKTIPVSADALGQVLSALQGAPHLIRELQATRSIALMGMGSPNPINTLIDDFLAATRRPGSAEVVTWFKASADGVNMPDAFKIVLIDRDHVGPGEPVMPAYWDGDRWCDIDGEPIEGSVVAFADMAKGRSGGAAC
jgi:hypothetical protein